MSSNKTNKCQNGADAYCISHVIHLGGIYFFDHLETLNLKYSLL